MRFELWDYQMEMFDHLENKRLLILLKARQLGMSWVCCAYALWMCLFQENKFVLIMSKGQPEAQEMVARIRMMYDSLPSWMKELGEIPNLERKTTSDLEWSNDSRVKSLAATKDAGSGYTASLVILDEFAKMLFAEDTYTAVKPTIDGGGKLVIISTAKGVGNTFHKLWVKAEKGENAYFAYFLPWHVRPGRNEKWYQEKVAEESDAQKIKQEYPVSAREAFLASGRARFNYDWIVKQEKNVCQPIPVNPPQVQLIPNLKIYKLPVYGRRYVLGGDPSQGTSTSDPSPATVVDAETWEEVALLHGRFEPTTFAYLCADLGSFYNNAFIVIGRNNHGHAVLAELLNHICYPNIAWGPDRQIGWPENIKSKPMMVDDFAEALKGGEVCIRSKSALDELAIYQINDNGSTSAPEGDTDDIATTWFFCITYLRRPRQQTSAPLPQSYSQPRLSQTYTVFPQRGYPNSNSRQAINVVPNLQGKKFHPGNQ